MYLYDGGTDTKGTGDTCEKHCTVNLRAEDKLKGAAGVALVSDSADQTYK